MTETKTPGPWENWTPEQFRADPVAVVEYRKFLETDTGKKFLAVVRGHHPTNLLVSVATESPAVLRNAAAVEEQSQGSLLGRILGYSRLALALTEGLTKPIQNAPPRSKRGGREILPETAVTPQ